MRPVVRLLRGQAIAILALVVALSGSAYAATVAAKNSVVSSSIKNGSVKSPDLRKGAVTGRQVRDNSLTGTDIRETTIGRVPEAVAAQLGGLSFGSGSGSCTPASTVDFAMCTEATFVVPAPGRLVLVGQAGISHRADNQYEASGECQYYVNGAAGAAPATYVAKSGGATVLGSYELRPLLGIVEVPAGTVTVGVWCRDIYYSKFDDVRFVAMLSAPPVS